MTSSGPARDPSTPTRFSTILVLVLALAGLTGCAKADPWAESALQHAVEQEDFSSVYQGLRSGRFKPNLRDIHSDEGALAKFSLAAAPMLLEEPDHQIRQTFNLFLDQAGYDELQDGRRLFWLMDKTRVQLPNSIARQGAPRKSGLISMIRSDSFRVTAGDAMSVPVARAGVSRFAGDWVAYLGTAVPDVEPLSVDWIRTRQTVELKFTGEEGLEVDGKRVAPPALAGMLKSKSESSQDPALVVRWWPGALYGDLVEIFDRLRTEPPLAAVPIILSADDETGDFGSRQLVLRLTPERSGPTLILKLDSRIELSSIFDLLSDVASSAVPSVLFLTRFQIPEDGNVAPGAFPGGLPGGIGASLDWVAATATSTPTEDSRSATSRREVDRPLNIDSQTSRPVPIHTPQPEYTEVARQAKIRGTVMIQAVIDREGRVREAKVLKGLPMGLSEQALTAARQWTFKPAVRDGEPVSVYYVITLNFRL